VNQFDDDGADNGMSFPVPYISTFHFLSPFCACLEELQANNTDNLQDFNELVSACSLAATTFNPSATATSGAPQSTGDAPASTTSAGTGSETQGPSQTSEAPGEQTSNAANGLSVQGLGAAVGLGCMVWGAM
jgi:hypothetical protein